MIVTLHHHGIPRGPSAGRVEIEHDDGLTHVKLITFDTSGHPQSERHIPLNEWKRMCAAFTLATAHVGPFGRDER